MRLLKKKMPDQFPSRALFPAPALVADLGNFVGQDSRFVRPSY
jgi:hypothetical protein